MEIKITLKKIIGNIVYFSAPDGEELILPKNLIPDNIKEGDVLYLKLSNNPQENKLSPESARALIEEIINVEE